MLSYVIKDVTVYKSKNIVGPCRKIKLHVKKHNQTKSIIIWDNYQRCLVQNSKPSLNMMTTYNSKLKQTLIFKWNIFKVIKTRLTYNRLTTVYFRPAAKEKQISGSICFSHSFTYLHSYNDMFRSVKYEWWLVCNINRKAKLLFTLDRT